MAPDPWRAGNDRCPASPRLARRWIASLSLGLLLLTAPAAGDDRTGGTSPAPPMPTSVKPSALPRLTLREAVRRALARNPSVAVARADILRAEALVRQVRSSALPTLAGSLIYTRLDGDRILGEGTPQARVIAGADAFSANATLTVPLLQTQRWVQWSHAKDNVLATRAGAEEVHRQVAISVARAYLAVIAQRRVVEVTERARDTAISHQKFAQTRLAGGAGRKIEVGQAAREVAIDEA
jgi:outer membrane protein